MAILIHDYYDLEERAGKHLKAWKAWHIVLYASAAIFGALNYIFLHNTMYMVDDNCLIRAPLIVFERIQVFHPNWTAEANETDAVTERSIADNATTETKIRADSGLDTDSVPNDGTVEEREVLDLLRTWFGPRQDCEFTEYMPIMSTVVALVWVTMFVMCPGGGHARTGLTKPWRILAPALVISLVLVGLTGSSFAKTNRGLREFCAAFHNYTNATTCSSVNVYMERSWNASWKFSSRAEATRAASAGVLACWACATTLLIVRCLAAPDFQLVRTGVYLAKDPEQKITPHILKSRRRRGLPVSPDKSPRSEPTATTELVPDSAPTSRSGTPTDENITTV